ncbi:polygalacturonase At1g48100-like isoform X1 [Silene latifolia]|uniref:polygalacturonase At1g48100-like isoform X1 n=1 Tax=Silene latifolia TaxID=37657 RepID=UPI003D77DB18
MANLYIVFAVLYCFLLGPIQGRILTLLPMDDHISLPPSPAPNAYNGSGGNVVDHYSHAPSPSSHTYNVTIESSPAPSPSSHTYNVTVESSPAPTPSIVVKNDTTIAQEVAVYDVMSLGAIGDGVTDDTAAFKSAWDTACQIENAKVLAPKGFTFLLQPLIFTGPCKSGLVFQVEGTIVPPDGPNSWPKKMSKKQWIIFYRAHGLAFQGSGLIDGRGEKWWNLPCKPHKGVSGSTNNAGPCDSPVAIRFFGTTNLTVRGVKFINSPEFHIRFDACQSVHVDSLFIKSPGNSPNTDGIHVENTVDVTIHNSVISNGDDCISIGAGSHNLDIKNVTCGPSHGISIGSLGVRNSRACVSNITVTNCFIKHSDNGVRIKTWQGGSGSVSDITFNNIKMDTVRNPVMIDQYYCLSKNCSNSTSAVSIASISYSNIKGTYDTRSPPVHLACSDSVPCTKITITDLDLLPALATGSVSTSKYGSLAQPFCWNAYGSLGASTVPPVYCLLEGLPPLDVPGGDVVGQC